MAEDKKWVNGMSFIHSKTSQNNYKYEETFTALRRS
jgi:hypothetical protein